MEARFDYSVAAFKSLCFLVFDIVGIYRIVVFILFNFLNQNLQP